MISIALFLFHGVSQCSPCSPCHLYHLKQRKCHFWVLIAAGSCLLFPHFPPCRLCSSLQVCCLAGGAISPFANIMSEIMFCFTLQRIESCQRIPEPCYSGTVYCLAFTGKLKAPVIAEFLLFILPVALETAQFYTQGCIFS